MSDAQAGTAAEPVVLQELTDDGVLVITLNRPERYNAWTLDMELLYNAAFDRAEQDARVRAVVITGAGRSFCPGLDLAVLDRAASGGRPYSPVPLPPRTRPLRCPKPVVAAVNGACAGIGFNQAVMSDLRFATPEATFAVAFSRLGLMAEDGVSWLLPRLVGVGHASDLLLSSRPVRGPEAAGMGLVNRLVPAEELLAAAVGYATELAVRCAPWAMASIKSQLANDQGRFDEAHEASLRLLAEAKRRPDYREGVRSRLEKRSPDFLPLPHDPVPHDPVPHDQVAVSSAATITSTHA